MEMDTTAEDRSHTNVCQCCLSESSTNYKYISEINYHLEELENYKDMLEETFGIQIQEAAFKIICNECVDKIRDATAFKRMVLNSQCVLTQFLESLFADLPTQGLNQGAENVLYEEDGRCSSDNDDDCLAKIKTELITDKIQGAKLEQGDVKKTLKRRSVLTIPAKKVNIKNRIRCEIPTNSSKIDHRGTGPILRENSLKLIKNSTMCVFQWHKSRFTCFCCKEPFSDISLLRDHTRRNHTLKNIEKTIISQQNLLVKVEVSQLFCTLCNQNLENLDSLRNHLTESHGVNYDLNDDLLVPFKINETLQCQICSERFRLFRLLNIHMNKHYKKQICHICGVAFSNLKFLHLHKTRSHRTFPCDQCNVEFLNKRDKKHHDINVHGKKFERKLRFPCTYCEKRFFQENLKILHLVESHGMARPEYKCDVCFKVFITKSLCTNHIKNVHLKEKKSECDICHRLFYTKSDVARHRVTHTGERKFSCQSCNRSFATKDSLRRHMKRTHHCTS